MPQSPQTMKIIFHGAAPSGFFHTDTFTTFHNFCTPFRFIVWNYFLKILIRIRYIQDAGKISSLWFFPNILDKTWIRIHFILYQYHGNLSISLKRGMYYAHKTYHTGTAERFESRRKKNVITRIVWCYRHPEFHSRQLWERWKCRYVTWQSSDACRLLSCKHRLSSLSNWTTWTQISQYPICISMMIQIKYWLMKNIIHGYYQNYYLIKASINSWPTWKSILMILMIKVFR